MSKALQEVKSKLWWIEVANSLCEYPSFKNYVFFKANNDEISEEYTLVYRLLQDVKSTLWWIKVANWLREYPYLKNHVFFKAMFKAFNVFYKDEISVIAEKGNLLYKLLLDEKNEQLVELQELRKILGEILEETNLFLKKFDEDEEGENEKKVKNNMIKIIKLTKPFFENLDEIMETMFKNERDGRTFDPKYERHPAEEPGFEEDAE